MLKNKLLWYVVVAVGAIAVIWGLAAKPLWKLGETSTPSPAPSPKTTVKLPPYSELVKIYEGRRIQFDARCQAVPSQMVVKNGDRLMFDNRSGDARTIAIDGVAYKLAGYGYYIKTMTNKALPKNILISCGAAVNVGQILIQR